MLLLFLNDKLHPKLAPNSVVESAELVAGQIALIIAGIEMIRHVEGLESDSKAVFLFEASGR